jgi:hypothetical protein
MLKSQLALGAYIAAGAYRFEMANEEERGTSRSHQWLVETQETGGLDTITGA